MTQTQIDPLKLQKTLHLHRSTTHKLLNDPKVVKELNITRLEVRARGGHKFLYLTPLSWNEVVMALSTKTTRPSKSATPALTRGQQAAIARLAMDLKRVKTRLTDLEAALGFTAQSTDSTD